MLVLDVYSSCPIRLKMFRDSFGTQSPTKMHRVDQNSKKGHMIYIIYTKYMVDLKSS